MGIDPACTYDIGIAGNTEGLVHIGIEAHLSPSWPETNYMAPIQAEFIYPFVPTRVSVIGRKNSSLKPDRVYAMVKNHVCL